MRRITSMAMLCCMLYSAASQSQKTEQNTLPTAQKDTLLETVLVFTKTAGYRHKSIEKGVATLEKLGAKNSFNVEQTEDASKFTEEVLKAYELVVFLSTTMDVLNEEQEAAFEQYIRNGGSLWAFMRLVIRNMNGLGMES